MISVWLLFACFLLLFFFFFAFFKLLSLITLIEITPMKNLILRKILLPLLIFFSFVRYYPQHKTNICYTYEWVCFWWSISSLKDVNSFSLMNNLRSVQWHCKPLVFLISVIASTSHGEGTAITSCVLKLWLLYLVFCSSLIRFLIIVFWPVSCINK